MKTCQLRVADCLLGITFVSLYLARAADYHVPADYLSIQEAVDAAASGDTIHIASGVYGEGVKITNKNLTLIGQHGAIIRTRVDNGLIEGLHKSSIVASNAGHVVLRGLTFEGDRRGYQLGETPWSAVYFANAGGVVENCRFIGYQGTTPTGEVSRIQAMTIIREGAGSPVMGGLRIAGNTILDCNNGIWMQADAAGLNATIESNVIHGLGPVSINAGMIPMAGITLRNHVHATVTGNTVMGFSYSGVDTQSVSHAGILVFGNNGSELAATPFMRFESNDFRSNDIHLMTLKGDGHEIINNRFQGTGVASRRAGIQFSGEGVVVRGNFLRDMPVGVTALGDDSVIGFDAGVAMNALIEDNRFRDVDTSVDVQPGATATLDGNLDHPFPDPELSIVPSVVISWPDYYRDDYLLENAPTLDGPWTESATGLWLLDGSWKATVEMSDEPLFFRLRTP